MVTHKDTTKNQTKQNNSCLFMSGGIVWIEYEESAATLKD